MECGADTAHFVCSAGGGDRSGALRHIPKITDTVRRIGLQEG